MEFNINDISDSKLVEAFLCDIFAFPGIEVDNDQLKSKVVTMESQIKALTGQITELET